MAETIIRPIGRQTISYGRRPSLRRSLEQVKLVIEDGRKSIVAIFKEGPAHKPDEPREMTIGYTSMQELDNFLIIWSRALEPEDVFKIRQHMSSVTDN